MGTREKTSVLWKREHRSLETVNTIWGTNEWEDTKAETKTNMSTRGGVLVMASKMNEVLAYLLTNPSDKSMESVLVSPTKEDSVPGKCQSSHWWFF